VLSWQDGTSTVCRYDAWLAEVALNSSTDAAAPEVRTTRMLEGLGGAASVTGDGVADGVSDDVGVVEAVPLELRVCVAVSELDAVCELEAVAVALCVAVSVEDAEAEEDAECVAEDVAVFVGVRVAEMEAPAVRLEEGEPVCVDEGDDVRLGDGVCVPVAVCVDEDDAVDEGEAVCEDDGVALGDGVLVGDGSAGTQRMPRKALPVGAVASSVKPAPTVGEAS
jgi:hypothetical protein